MYSIIVKDFSEFIENFNDTSIEDVMSEAPEDTDIIEIRNTISDTVSMFVKNNTNCELLIEVKEGGDEGVILDIFDNKTYDLLLTGSYWYEDYVF